MMFARCLATAAFALALAGTWAQTAAPTAAQQRASQVLTKARQVDLLNQILPVVLTKEQIGKLLPAIERARQAVRDAEDRERTELNALEPKLDAAIKDAIEKNLVPSRDVLNNAFATFRAMQLRRESIANANVTAILTVIQESWNSGQRKAAANALRPEAFDPAVDAAKLTEEQRLRFFVRMILLDPLAYDLLIRLRASAPS
jgi:hypothetical protein